MAKAKKKTRSSKGAAKKPAKRKAGKAAKPAKKAAAKSAKPAKKAAVKKAAVKKPAVKKPAKHAAKPRQPVPQAPEPDDVAEAAEELAVEAGVALADLTGRAMIVQIVGDAEAYFFDFASLSPDKRAELIEHHIAAYDRRKREEGKPDWVQSLVPIALLGESMPPPVRGQFDLSAPHEGVLLLHADSGAVLYAASKDDEKLAILGDLEMLSPTASYVAEVFDPNTQSYAYVVDRGESQGFTLGQIQLLMETAGSQLMLV